MSRKPGIAPLNSPRNEGYAAVWDALAEDPLQAIIAMDGSQSEAELRRNGDAIADRLCRALALTEDHRVLEVGCGLARIGRAVASRVGRWVGVDVSPGMLCLAKQRLEGVGESELVLSSGSDLGSIADASVDAAYCHWTFIHMDKEDMFALLQATRRALVPGGLFYFDIWNLCHPVGWLRFQVERGKYRDKRSRPLHRNQFASPDEVRTMARMAGFEVIHLAESLSIHAVVSAVPQGEDPEPFVARRREELGKGLADLQYNDEECAAYAAAMREMLRSAGQEPEELRPQ